MIVAMTAHAMKGDRERCLDCGMDDYVAKPIQRKELDEVLARMDAIRSFQPSLSRSAIAFRPAGHFGRAAMASRGTTGR